MKDLLDFIAEHYIITIIVLCIVFQGTANIAHQFRRGRKQGDQS